LVLLNFQITDKIITKQSVTFQPSFGAVNIGATKTSRLSVNWNGSLKLSSFQDQLFSPEAHPQLLLFLYQNWPIPSPGFQIKFRGFKKMGGNRVSEQGPFAPTSQLNKKSLMKLILRNIRLQARRALLNVRSHFYQMHLFHPNKKGWLITSLFLDLLVG
jgi:hypothetical protein